MKAAPPHLNLLHPEERLSSSPIRVRVMLPILAITACGAAVIWWGVLFMQLLLLRGEVASIKTVLEQRKQEHSTILSEMAHARDCQAEVDQLQGYANGRRRYGALLSRLAEAMPEGVQLTSLVIPEPPPQQLRDPAKPLAPALLGPTNVTEAVWFRLSGRTQQAAQVTELLTRFTGAEVTNALVVTGQQAPNPSPRIRSFTQESTVDQSGRRLLAFEVEYRGVERRFSK